MHTKNTDISMFLDNEGKIIKIPVPNRTKIPLLNYLAGKFETGRDYSEKEVNKIIDSWHTFKDYFILRRLLIDYNLMNRTPNGARYWVVEQKVDANDEIVN
ncbi:hypothetical protein SDC9_192880 [bioreactor metagenome]|uniref:DUF2087 domain-containing protein n=1 Tax=bioreactor metagenome TaxID=1076179 RepID=A0A645ID07_9ZZZZ